MTMKKKHKKGREQSAIITSRETPETLAAGFRHKLHEHPQLRKALPVMLVLVAVNLFIYAQVRYFEFIGWDDPLYITQNTEVSKGLSWPGAMGINNRACRQLASANLAVAHVGCASFRYFTRAYPLHERPVSHGK